MKVIVAGSRSIQQYETVSRILTDLSQSLWQVSEIVSGHARGVDQFAEAWAKVNGISLKIFPAGWNKHGKSAGVVRNSEMAHYADALVAIWDGESRGTANMITTAKRLGLPVTVWTPAKHGAGGGNGGTLWAQSVD